MAKMVTYIQAQLPVFLRVSRFWDHLKTRRMLGISHSLSEQLNQKIMQFVLRCPACLKLGVNISKEEFLATPHEMEHTTTMKFTSDGNFQMNQFKKSNGTDTRDLIGEQGYSASRGELDKLDSVKTKSEVRTLS